MVTESDYRVAMTLSLRRQGEKVRLLGIKKEVEVQLSCRAVTLSCRRTEVKLELRCRQEAHLSKTSQIVRGIPLN